MTTNKHENNINLDDLASMIKGEFERIDKQMVEASRERSEIKREIENIAIRLDNVAFRFEVQELEKKIRLIESIVADTRSRANV